MTEVSFLLAGRSPIPAFIELCTEKAVTSFPFTLRLPSEGFVIPKTGFLEKWAKQGVLLLNTSLTVRANLANSHSNIGWQIFTDRIIELLNERKKPLVL